MNRVVVLSESWHPQGGGAELATYMYTREVIRNGNKVTIASNQEASFDDIISQNCEVWRLPLREVKISAAKASLLLKSRSIRKKIGQLVETNDTIYIPGRLIFLSPWLKKLNQSVHIIVHLHEYQLICPHASLLNMIHRKTCHYIWSNIDCMRCTQRFMRADRKSLLGSYLGAATTAYWKWAADTKSILDSVDTFVAVSNRESTLIKENLARFVDNFEAKCITLHNPVDTTIPYVSHEFQKGRPLLGYFGGDRYVKGFYELLNFVNHLSDQSFKLVASRIYSSVSQTERFEFLGNLDAQAMSEIYKRLWIVLFTSVIEEPSPYVVVESQLRGRPVVATSLGGVPENIVKQGFTGSLLGVGEYDKFQTIVQHYASMIDERGSDYTAEISLMSKDFFEKRTSASYERFLRLIER